MQEESEETARKRQAQECTPLLPRLGILADSSSVPVSAVVAAAAADRPILPSVQHDSEAEVGDKRPAP